MPRREDSKELIVRPCVGGLQTKYPAPIVVPSQSPDLENILFDRRSVRRRDGCVPVNRFLAPKDSLRNQGLKFIGRDGALPAANFKSVPGHGIIGHRPVFNTYRDPSGVFANLTVSFLCMPEADGDNYSEPANWFTWNTNAAGAQRFAGYRPICSKGPLRSNEYLDGDALGWSIGIYNDNGGAAGGPFAAAGTAVWYALVQTNPLAAPLLLRSSTASNRRPRPGHIYRITLAVSSITAGTGNARLIISELLGDRTVATEVVTVALGAGVLTTNSNPILIFDMPPPVLNAPNARGGLNVGAAAWEESSLRFEGRLQDLSVWRIDKMNNQATPTEFVQSMVPLDISVDQDGLLGYWKPDVTSDKYGGTWDEDQTLIPEGRGMDAPMLLCPAVPKWNRSNGRSSLYFNGRTSFCFMPTAVNTTFAGGAAPTGGQNNPAFVIGATHDHAFERLTLAAPQHIALGHSISLTFIPDSLEAAADVAHGVGAETESQCLMYWFGVVKFGISSRGRIYCAAFDAAGWAATQFFDPFPGFALEPLKPGQRYTIVYRRTAANAATLYLNTLLIGNPTVAAATPGVLSGLPLMLLGTEDSVDTTPVAPIVDISSGRENTRATLRTRHFHGRIEDVRVAGATLNPAEAFQIDLQEADLYKDGSKTWGLNGDSSAGGGAATAVGERTADGRAGFMVSVPAHYSNQLTVTPFYSFLPQVPLWILTTLNNTTYTLIDEPRSVPENGFDLVSAQFGRTSQYVAWWNFAPETLGGANSLAANLESRYRTSREWTGIEFIYRQMYAIPDKLGFALPMTLCSREPSQLGGAILTFYPWLQITPQEMTPKLAMGLVPDLPSENPITLLAQHFGGDRFNSVIAAAGASVYWLKPPWAHESPYPPSADPGQISAFFSGRLWNHIQVNSNTTWDLRSANQTLTVSFWIKVPELGVRREIAMNWDGVAVDAYNWRIVLTESGAIHCEGYIAGPAFWRFGTIAADTPNDRFHTPVTPGRWRFVEVQMDTAVGHASQAIFVDGERQPLDATVGAYAANWLGGAGAKWIGGHRHDLPFPDSAPASTEDNVEPFFGWMRDFRVSANAALGIVPREPLDATGAVTLLPLNEGDDNSLGAIGTTVARGTMRMEEMLPILDGGFIANHSTPNYPYDSIQNLGVLYLTNGLGNPLAIRHDGRLRNPRNATLAGTRQPWGFRVTRMGLEPPGFDLPTITGEDTGGGPFVSGAPLVVAVTFMTQDGVESDPVVYTFVIPAGGNWRQVRIDNLPRSLDGHVVARRIYVGVTTQTLFTATVNTADNYTDQVELTTITGNGRAVTTGKGRPPRARFIKVHKGRAFMLNQLGAQAPLELYVSQPPLADDTTCENFGALNVVRLESGSGEPGSFVVEHLGALYCGTRDSLFAFSLGQTFETSLVEKLNASKGFAAGHSVAPFDNHVFGVMERGVHVFDGSGVDYLGEDLEGIWRGVDISDAGVLRMFGRYFETLGQYWVTVRRTGETFGRELLVFDKVVMDPNTGRHPWSRLKTVRHSYLQRVDDEVTRLPKLLLGTPEGQVMEMLVGQIDGSRQVADPATGALFTLAGTCGTTTTLSVATLVGASAFTVATTVGAVAGGSVVIGLGTANQEAMVVLAVTSPTQFTTVGTASLSHGIGDTVVFGGSTTSFGSNLIALDILGNGLRGLWGIVTHANGTIEEFRILSNTTTTVAFESALQAAVAAGDTFVIGAYWAYYSTPWLPLGSICYTKVARWVDLDFFPQSGTLDVRVLGAIQGHTPSSTGVALADAFNFAAAINPEGRKTVPDMTYGYIPYAIRFELSRALYWRMAFGTRGINKPFEVFGWAGGFEDDGNNKGKIN